MRALVCADGCISSCTDMQRVCMHCCYCGSLAPPTATGVHIIVRASLSAFSRRERSESVSVALNGAKARAAAALLILTCYCSTSCHIAYGQCQCRDPGKRDTKPAQL